MTRANLISKIFEKQTFLCVGLDTDLTKIPKHLLDSEDPIFEFNKAIIDATHRYAIAYKPNLAFYEASGIKGLQALKKTADYLKNFDVFTIADAKRGDIGNTSEKYAEAFLSPDGDFNFDAITIAPYMGADSVTPFLTFPEKWVILLALTSNKGAFDFQFLEDKENGQKFFETVLEASKKWGTPENMMYVVGATQADWFIKIRQLVPDHFLLVPGVGAQGGSLQEVCKYGMTKNCGLLINASRSILYASDGLDFAEKAEEEVKNMQQEMSELLTRHSCERGNPPE